MNQPSPIIQTNSLTKVYGKARGIDDISLSVSEGEFFGFIGPNGAGKSTTIRVLLGMLPTTSGNASIFGKDCWKDKTEILKHVGYLPSESSFYQGMRVKDILKLSAKLRKKDCKKEAEELCSRLQLDITRKVDELSFGNKKKVAIVCALQHDPKLLVLDEPTSGLDPLMQKEFFDIIDERGKKGTTVFMSSHILSEVQKYCTRAAIIRTGKIIACDSVENLKKTNVKRVSFLGSADLSALSSIRDIKTIGSQTSFLYGGEPKELLTLLASGDIQDLTIQEPDLEEIFLHYYEEV